ncbi:hypothetical protein HGM15179_019056 [Zosterops borbonicus]|uniref:Integrase catalytic domain-containing protein n=1 Tax=Zosterops borbonicus TaxID=364589 RepID=A0A8K1DB69_9PASS|nr:hypothetical protein HGM15179_019056 [Zosterops borbonicus]
MGGAKRDLVPLAPAPALNASPVSMPQTPANPTVAGAALAAASQTPPSSESGNAVSMAPPVFTLGSGGSTAIMARSRGPQSGALSSANHWTLRPCQVTVCPRDLKDFWDEVKSKVLEVGDWDMVDWLMGPEEGPSGSASTERNILLGAVNPGQVSASVPVTQTDTVTLQGGVQAFPVLRGIAALVRTIELAAPKQKFVTIVQGSKESFLDFVERLSAGVEKQMDDVDMRTLLVKQLARTNSNSDCKKLIEALPGDPSLTDMVKVCANVGTIDHKMAAFTTALQSAWKGPKGRQQKHRKAQASKKQGKQKTESKSFPFFLFLVWKAKPYCKGLYGKSRCQWSAFAKFGKREAECQGETHTDTNISSSPDAGLLSQLAASTCGSASVDVCTAAIVVLDSCKVHKVPLDAFGPLGEGKSAFLIGRSSATLQGIIVHLGLIDADYMGQDREPVVRGQLLQVYQATSSSLDFSPDWVNPRGLKALQIWQTDVTQITGFGQLKYVHVSMDTFSSAMWASAHSGGKTHNVIARWRQAFAVLCIPSTVKTDNGPAYTLQKVQQFLQLWGVSHKFGIPHFLTGQAIVECTHDTGVHWVPAKCVHPDLQLRRQNRADRQPENHDQNESHQAEESSSDYLDADDHHALSITSFGNPCPHMSLSQLLCQILGQLILTAQPLLHANMSKFQAESNVPPFDGSFVIVFYQEQIALLVCAFTLPGY